MIFNARLLFIILYTFQLCLACGLALGAVFQAYPRRQVTCCRRSGVLTGLSTDPELLAKQSASRFKAYGYDPLCLTPGLYSHSLRHMQWCASYTNQGSSLRKWTSSATSVVYQLYGTTTPFRSIAWPQIGGAHSLPPVATEVLLGLGCSCPHLWTWRVRETTLKGLPYSHLLTDNII